MIPAWIMPDKVVLDAMHAGLAYVANAYTTGTIDTLLQRIFFNESEEKRAQLRGLFEATDLSVIEQFPLGEQTFPCYGVSLETEANENYVGESGARDGFLGGGQGTMNAERWTSMIVVVAYADHPEVTRWLHHLAKWLIASQTKRLTASFGQGMSLKSQNFKPYEHSGPHGGRLIYSRGVVITGVYDQRDANIEEPLQIDDIATPLPTGADYARSFGPIGAIQ